MVHLFVPDIVRTGGSWFLHGNQAEHLEQVVLHDITDGDKKEQVVTQKTLTELESHQV